MDSERRAMNLAGLPRGREQHQTSGVTTRLILAYVEREGGGSAVEELLERCDLLAERARLRDQTAWFDFATKVRLLETAAVVLGDDDAAFRLGAAAIDLNVASGLKLALRTLGNPSLVYANVGLAAERFTWAHRFQVVDLSERHARLRYQDVAGVGYHRADCHYNAGLLSCIPTLFGQLPAHVRHLECGATGDDACVYEVHWSGERASAFGVGAVLAAASVGALAVSVRQGGRAAAAAAVPLLTGAVLGRRALQREAQRARALEAALRDQQDAARRLASSLRDMVADLRPTEVLHKIVANAQATAVGKEFAVLDGRGTTLTYTSSSRIPPHFIPALERWARTSEELRVAPLLVTDPGAVPGLARLATDPDTPLAALWAAPLMFAGRRLGALLALAYGNDAFLPEETDLLSAYADQAAIALNSADTVEHFETMARQDPLTGLLNHREFHAALEREVHRAERYGHPLSVALLDLDGFKSVNDELGHPEGDRVLRMVADELSRHRRSSDSAGRLGGDEFALVLPEVTSVEAMAAGQRLARSLRELGLPVGISFGVSEFPRDGRTKDELVDRADCALYAAKRERRSRDGGAAVGS